MSSNLTAESSTVNTFDIRGIPAKCVCGTATTIFTADTHHLFKWVEDAVLEEVEDALPKIAQLEAEVAKGKSDVGDLKGVITELMEEVVRTKTELKRCEVKMKILDQHELEVVGVFKFDELEVVVVVKN
ncbi:uncharacterized protein At1g43920, Chloroplastic-like [Brassica napus]|uniref:uncharacterized protein At1g43920, Chloroplastic-like n=1 Tax=Brassica napus TaxID=3708 RepID=UPI0006AB7605|nr:uncharacterized protein At1g43920, Chloroplastic-like [Brassica napus]